DRGVTCSPQGDHARSGRGGFTLAQFQGPGPQHGPTEEEKARIRERIGITRQQQQQIEQMFESSGKQMKELRDRYRDLTRKLNDEVYAHFDFDRNEAKSLRKEIMSLHWKMGQIHDNNELQLRNILSRDQFEKMKAM